MRNPLLSLIFFKNWDCDRGREKNQGHGIYPYLSLLFFKHMISIYMASGKSFVEKRNFMVEERTVFLEAPYVDYNGLKTDICCGNFK